MEGINYAMAYQPYETDPQEATMSPLGSSEIQYPEALAAVGRFIAKHSLTNVCIMEFEKGVIITGSVLYEAGESYQRRTEMHVLSEEELRRMIRGH